MSLVMKRKIEKYLLVLNFIIVWMLAVFASNNFEIKIVLVSTQIAVAVVLCFVNFRKSLLIDIACLGLLLVFALISSIVNSTDFYNFLMISGFSCQLIALKNLVFSVKEYFVLQSILTGLLCLLLVIFYPNENGFYRSIFPFITIVMNPNCYAIYSFATVVIAINLVNLTKLRYKKIVSLLILLCGSVLIYYAKSRTSLFALILFGLFFFLKDIRLTEKKKFPFFALLTGCIVGLLVTVGYVALYHITDGSFIILGKNFFSGRQNIWSEAYRLLGSNWLFGFAHGIQVGDHIFGLHNCLLEIWCEFGIIPFLILIFLFVYRKQSGILVKPIFAGLLAFTFIMIFEGVFLYSALCTIPLLFFINQVDLQGDRSIQQEELLQK